MRCVSLPKSTSPEVALQAPSTAQTGQRCGRLFWGHQIPHHAGSFPCCNNKPGARWLNNTHWFLTGLNAGVSGEDPLPRWQRHLPSVLMWRQEPEPLAFLEGTVPTMRLCPPYRPTRRPQRRVRFPHWVSRGQTFCSSSLPFVPQPQFSSWADSHPQGFLPTGSPGPRFQAALLNPLLVP